MMEPGQYKMLEPGQYKMLEPGQYKMMEPGQVFKVSLTPTHSRAFKL